MKLSVDSNYADGIQKELELYNSRPNQSEDNPPLSAEEFLYALLIPTFEAFNSKHDIKNTTDLQVIKNEARTNPMGLQAAILAKDAEDAAKLVAEKQKAEDEKKKAEEDAAAVKAASAESAAEPVI